jgi:cytochrome c nitrite reductase small subunit
MFIKQWHNIKFYAMNFYYKLIFACGFTGIVLGMGIFTFIYADGYSYFSNNPASCANCHVMNDHYNAWLKSSHKLVATCNDCHMPHNSILAKFIAKADNGFWHSFGFTTGRYHDPIMIRSRNIEIVEKACRHCHGEITAAIEAGYHQKSSQISCIKCHDKVGH